MKCKMITAMMSDYIEDDLSGHLRLEFEIHIEECPACAAEFEEIKRMLTSLRTLSAERSPVDCRLAIGSRIAEIARPQPLWKQWLLRPIVAAPAAVAILLLALMVMFSSPARETISQETAPGPEYVRYISAHSRVQRHQALTDPDVTFVATELETATLVSHSEGQ